MPTGKQILEAEDDSELSVVAENLGRNKSKTVYQECPIDHEKFPSRRFSDWKLWVKHYESVVKANGLFNMQTLRPLLLA